MWKKKGGDKFGEKVIYLSWRLLKSHTYKHPMDSRTKVSLDLMAFIDEYESGLQKGIVRYLSDREYQDIISYYEGEGEYQQAINVIDAAIIQYSFRSDYLALKARMLIKQGLNYDALTVIEKAEVMAPADIELQLLKVNALIHTKQIDDAIVLIEDLKSYASKQEQEDILVAESYLYENVQEFELMFQCLKSALMLNPHHQEALYLMAASVEQSKNFEESILLHNVIVDNHPYNHLAWFNLGHSYANVGEYDKAIEALEYSYIIYPRFEQGYLDCADCCMDQTRYDQALDIYNEYLYIFGPDFDLMMSISECQYELGFIDKAKRSLFKAIEMDAYSDEAYFLLAKCYMNNKDWRSAVKVLRKAISLEGNVEEYYHALGKCYIHLEDKGRAIHYLKLAVTTGSELASYWEDLVLYLISHHEYAQAIDCIVDSAQSTFSYRLQYLEAACHIGLSNIKKGLRLLEEVLLESYRDHIVINETHALIYNHKDVRSIIHYYKDNY